MTDRLAGKTVLITGSAGGLGREYALVYAREGAAVIRCVGIAPGLMETEASRGGVEGDNWERLKGMQMVKRQGTAQDIANLGLFLASDEGSFINNQVILCDGGNQLRGFRI